MRPAPRRLLHGLPPAIEPGARVLILGSFPSCLSLERSQYYANPQNQFWRIIEAVAGIDHTLPYRDRLSGLACRRIALYDAIGSCRRAGSADSSIREACCNPLRDLLASHPGILLIACNGRASARSLEGISPLPVPVLALPSTSPAYARMSLADKIRAWSVICGYLDG